MIWFILGATLAFLFLGFLNVMMFGILSDMREDVWAAMKFIEKICKELTENEDNS